MAGWTLRVCVAALAVWVVLRVLVWLGLALFVPAIQVRSITPWSIARISWLSPARAHPHLVPATTQDAAIALDIRRVSLCLRWSKDASDGSAWLVLRVEGVSLRVPKLWLTGTDPSPTPTTRTQSPGPSTSKPSAEKPPPPPPGLPRILTRLLPLLSFISLEVALHIIVQDVLTVSTTLRAGIHSAPSPTAKTPNAAAWLSFSTFLMHELPISHSVTEPPLPTAPPPPTQPSLWPAIAIIEPVILRARAPLAIQDASNRSEREGVEVEVAFGKGHEGVHVRVHELKRILRAFDEIQLERIALGDVGTDTDAKKKETCPEPRPRESRAHPDALLALLATLSVEIFLPLFVISAHYTTPLHILAISPKRPLPESVAFALTVTDIAVQLRLGGSTDEVGEATSTHRAWLGRHQNLFARLSVGWREIAGRIKVNGSEEDILPNSAKGFSIGSSSLALTTTSVPRSLTHLFPSSCPSSIPALQNPNDSTLIISSSLGPIRGHVTFETFDSALRIFKARPRPSPPAAPTPTSPSLSSPLPPKKFVYAVPRIVAGLAFEGVELRVQAPEPTEAKSRQPGVEYSEDQFYRDWMSPDVFCVSLPGGEVAFGGEWSERSLRRSEAERRRARRLSRRVAQERASEEASEQSNGGEEIAVPPPPPLSPVGKRVREEDTPAAGTAEVERRPLEYKTRFNAGVETLNIYMLATNDGTADPEDATSWLDEKPTLPSDPIRFDFLAIGPIEVTAHTQLLGIDGAALDLQSHTGEVGVLVETIGVDLWRPPVMSALRDFVDSFASASATSTLRTPSSCPSAPPPALRPLVDSLPPEILLYVAIASLDMRVAGSDPKNDVLACRGVAAHTDTIVLEYLLQRSLRPEGSADFPSRASLSLREDIRGEANAHVAAADDGAVLVKVAFNGIHVDPVVDARRSRGYTRKSSMPGKEEEDGDDWELKNRAEIVRESKHRRKMSIVPLRQNEAAAGLVAIPEIDFRVMITRAREGADGGALDDVVLSVEASTLSFRLELFSIYLVLVAIGTVKSLSPQPRSFGSPSAPSSPAMERSTSTSSQFPAPKRPLPILNIETNIADLHLFLTLPQNVPLYIHSRRLRLQYRPAIGAIIESDMILLAGTSPTVRSQWEDIIRFRILTITVQRDVPGDGYPFVVGLAADSARLRIPFRYVFAQVIDNTANLVKALKQLVHQHIKGGLDWILEPVAEDAKHLPKIDLNVKMLAIEIQDDPFETRLNIMWRAGYEEQIARLERQAAFDVKVEAIERAEAVGGEETDDDDEPAHLGPGARKPKVSGKHSISIAEARRDLAAYNSSHWVKRMRNAIAEQGRREEANTRRLYGARRVGDNKLPIDLLPTSRSSPLARAMFWDLRFVVTKPTYNVPDFLFDVGKGLPRETQFTLLIPLHFSWKMEQARVQLRDYPLPLVHVPPMGGGAGHDHASWECEADLVIAEEVAGSEAVRRVPCAIVPSRAANAKGTPLYSITVPRSAMPVKTYATPTIKIRSPFGTRIGWGNSIQPAIQDVTKVLDTLTKASPDPSERIGFWDKIRLQFHWRVKVLFQGDGPVHFHLKGTRDPYSVTGFGAGFVKTWSGDVRFLIGLENPDREFFQIESDRYVLGIPNLRTYVDTAASGLTRDPGENDDRSTQHSQTTGGELRSFGEAGADYIKICAKFINGVRWGLGAVLEHACTADCPKAGCKGKTAFNRQCRFFDFIPHWDVHTKTKDAVGPNGEVDDSFAGFRSDFIHFSISLTSPLTLSLPSYTGTTPEDEGPTDCRTGFNSLHFSPQAATHFWAWWRLFDGSMSLPIRQGQLFPSAQPPSKKFGKHCATIKYRFSLAPLFIAHTYRQESWAEWNSGETTVVGLKGKIGRFNVDLHQREQEEVVQNADSTETKKVLHKAFYQAEVDLDGVDLRVLTAVFKEPEKQVIVPDEVDEADETVPPPKQNYEVKDEDLEWIDLDDYVDAAYTFPDRNPSLRVLPFTVCPRFTYYRQTDTTPKEDLSGSEDSEQDLEHGGKSKFGHEPSHTCLMGCATDTITVQIDSARHRLNELLAEAKLVANGTSKMSRIETNLRIAAIQKIIDRLVALRAGNAHPLDDDQAGMDDPFNSRPGKNEYGGAPPIIGEEAEDGIPNSNSTIHQQEWGDWTNRYMVHNPAIQISNTTREVLLQYYYSQRERRGFMYHLSAKAIKFIRDLAKEAASKKQQRDQPHYGQRSGRHGSGRTSGTQATSSTTRSTLDETKNTNRLLDGISGGLFYAPNESAEGGPSSREFGDALDVDPETATGSLPDCFDLQSGHLCIFIKPQISLKSDIDDKSSMTLTAFRAQLKSYQVIDLRIPDDPVNRQVLSQTFATLDGLQAFYPHEEPEGRPAGAFVPLETLVDLSVDPWGFDRVVPRTSAALRYDKFNQLRMSSKNGLDDAFGDTGPQDTHFQTGTDRVSVECEKFSVSANPDHFAAIYNVVTDLLLYNDPLQKSRNKKLEEIVFTHDFSNLTGVASLVLDLQQRIRGLHETVQQYQVHLDELDEQSRLELFATRAEFVKLSAELNLVVLAIARAQNFNGASTAKAGVQFEARAAELVWHMLEASGTPFAKFSIKGVEFSWISKQDSSISNRLVIRDLKALNSSPEQVFAEIIAKYDRSEDHHQLSKINVFAAVLWNSLAPVGGISIVEQFEFHLHPVRLQLEHRIGRKILDYIFSQRKSDRAPEDSPPEIPAKQPARAWASSSLAPLGSSVMNKSSESLALSTRQGQNGSNRPRSILEAPGRNGLASGASSLTTESTSRLRKVASTEVLRPQGQEEGLDADEMRRRASLNRTFILVDFSPTVLYLTYRSEKEDHSRLLDIYDLTYRTPNIQYRSKTWSFLDLLNELKRDMIKSVWSQKGALIGQLLSTAHRKLPDGLGLAAKTAKRSFKSRLHIGTSHSSKSTPSALSPLRITTQKPTSSFSDAAPAPGLPASPSRDSLSSNSDDDEPSRDDRVLEDMALFSADPEQMSQYAQSSESSQSPDRARVSDDLILGVDLQSRSFPSLPRPFGRLEERHAASLPALLRQDSPAGYPIHTPLTRSLSFTQSEAAKAKLLLGEF